MLDQPRRVIAAACDGACSGNPGPGGWGALLRFEDGAMQELGGADPATTLGAELLGIEDETGTIDVGLRADLLVHDHNPLEDFKLMYATGAWRLNDDTGQAQWNRGLNMTLCAGMVYDVSELLADLRDMVDESWKDAPDERPPGP